MKDTAPLYLAESGCLLLLMLAAGVWAAVVRRKSNKPPGTGTGTSFIGSAHHNHQTHHNNSTSNTNNHSSSNNNNNNSGSNQHHHHQGLQHQQHQQQQYQSQNRQQQTMHSHNEMLLHGRKLGIYLGASSLIASCMCDKFIYGTSEQIFKVGLTWILIPIGSGLSLLFGGLLFAKPMRKKECVTMLDPFQQHYGAWLGGLLFLPALLADLFWCAAILRVLGNAFSTLAGIEPLVTIPSTAVVIATYTIAGGLYSVAWANALQLLCIVVGVVMPTTYNVHQAWTQFVQTYKSRDWHMDIHTGDLGFWIDGMLLAIFGGIPWQGYFQRVLSTKSPSYARTMSISSMFGCLVLMSARIIIGIILRGANGQVPPGHSFRNQLVHDHEPLRPIQELPSHWVIFIGLGAISSAVMSSADSRILAMSSMFTRNVYKLLIRPKAADWELDWILRIGVTVASVSVAFIALTFTKVYLIAYSCAEIVYITLFPQLLAVIHWPSLVDSYGCLVSLVVSILIRLSGGDSQLGIPVYIEYPFYDGLNNVQKFPLRTCAMLSAIFSQLVISFVTRNLLGKGYFPRCCDILSVYSSKSSNMKSANGRVAQSTSGSALIDCSTFNDASPGHMSDTPTTLSSSRTDVESTTPDSVVAQHTTQSALMMRQQSQQQPYQNNAPQVRHPQVCVLYDSKTIDSRSSGGGLRAPGQTATINRRQSPALHQQLMATSPVAPGQILGVKNLSLSDCPPPRIVSPLLSPYSKTSAPSPVTTVTTGTGTADRSHMELNLNSHGEEHHGHSGGKKNIKGVKLIGMDSATLRRTSLQGTFSPTPSVEMVNIFDRRQSSGSYGPASLSPIPGVEACKTHGTALGGQNGTEHCQIKRGIVRHHSFNDTSDRSLTTLARQPTYPSMPLRSEDGKLQVRAKDAGGGGGGSNKSGRHSAVLEAPAEIETRLLTATGVATLRRDRRSASSQHNHHQHHPITRHSSVADDKGYFLVSPTYAMYNSAAKSCNYFVSDDEAVSRF